MSETNSRTRVFWRAVGCKAGHQHIIYCTPYAVLKNAAALTCIVCNLDLVCKQGSCKTVDVVHEPRLWALMHAKFAGHAWTVQCKVVRGWKGAVDLVVFGPRRVLCVQVDGFSHTSENRGCLGTTLQEQLCKDAEFNALAIRLEFGVLRLHDDDADQWEALLRASIAACMGAGAWPTYAASRSIKCKAPSM